jgi:hypothetical protein
MTRESPVKKRSKSIYQQSRSICRNNGKERFGNNTMRPIAATVGDRASFLGLVIDLAVENFHLAAESSIKAAETVV